MLKKISSIIFAILYVFSVLVGSTFVRCEDGNGNSAIEVVHQSESHCSEENHSSDLSKSNEPDSVALHEEECVPCTDTSLITDSYCTIESKSSKISTELFTESKHSSVDYGTFPCLEKSIYSKPPPRLSSTLASLRTIILII